MGTEWVVNLFVQPDPFVDTADNAKTITSVTSDAAKAVIDTVTKTKYGTMTAKPAAVGGAKKVTISGSTDVAAYVYCAVSKTASRLRMLNTTNASNATNATKTAVVSNEPVNLQSADTALKYHVKRSETTATKLDFSHVFDGLLEGKTYEWMCEATSLSPSNPSFRTALEKGTVSTNAAP